MGLQMARHLRLVQSAIFRVPYWVFKKCVQRRGAARDRAARDRAARVAAFRGRLHAHVAESV